MTDSDRQLLIEMNHTLGSIEQHLKNLNSKVATNVNNIEKNRIDVNIALQETKKELADVKLKQALYSGGLAVIIFTITLATQFL